MSEQWLGLHNPERHALIDTHEAWCKTCEGPKRDDGSCWDIEPCRCCMEAEVAALALRAEKAEAAVARVREVCAAADASVAMSLSRTITGARMPGVVKSDDILAALDLQDTGGQA